MNNDKRKLADAFPDFVVAYNDTLAQEGLGRLILDPYSMLTYSTRAEDYEAIKRLREQGVSVADAIEQLVTQRGVRT